MGTTQPDIELLGRTECLRLLSSAPFGRLVYTIAALPAVQPVNFAIVGDAVVVRTASESKLSAATRNTVVAFEADHIDTLTRAGWSVTVVGRCYQVVNPTELAELAQVNLESWGRPGSDRFIAIRIEQISGRWLHSPVVSAH